MCDQRPVCLCQRVPLSFRIFAAQEANALYTTMVNIDFEKIYLNQSKQSGRMRVADLGLGWKASGEAKEPFLLPTEEMLSTIWSRGCRGYELRVQTKNKGVILLDGFAVEDYAQLKQEMQRNFLLNLEHREHSLRGWNWGKSDFARNELVFQVNNKPAFELPYADISNANLTGKNEVAVEMNLDSGKAGDELVEMRFYIPGMVENEEKKDEKDEAETAVSTETQASVFYEQLKDRANIGQVAGEAIVSFSDVLFLTPRGRYDIDMYPGSLRLRGKTYDYKIQYKQIERIFSLPKPDDTHQLMVLQIDPPLRQGQTRYPFLVMQFAKEEEIEVELNVSDEDYEKYKERLKRSYDAQTYLVMSHCFKGLSERRVRVAGQNGCSFGWPRDPCSLKASEGYLYPLERCFLFVTKPTIYIPFSEVLSVSMSRTGTGGVTSRTFDLEVTLKGSGSHVFANIEKEEQETIENYCTLKGLKVQNEEKIAKAMIAKAINEADEDVDMGSADSESEDGDFDAQSESDVAEEFDSEASASDSGADDDDEPPKKKVKEE